MRNRPVFPISEVVEAWFAGKVQYDSLRQWRVADYDAVVWAVTIAFAIGIVTGALVAMIVVILSG